MNVAFIPVRGGSKSIPHKNIRAFAGRPLVYWAVSAASGCGDIDRVYVSTDDDRIRAVVDSFGLEKVSVIGRGEETATDTASTESAMLEFAGAYEFDGIALIQATSPLLTSGDLSNGFQTFHGGGFDSVLSVVRQGRFIWRRTDGAAAEPVNYDFRARPRRQEFEGQLVENGAFYITTREGLLASGCRLSGRVGAVEMPPETYIEIDEPVDWQMAEQLLMRRLAAAKGRLPRLSDIRMLVSDCDGCLTDGGMYYSEGGDELKRFNTRDGHAFRMLRERGIVTCILTGEDMELNRRRARKMVVDEIVSGSRDKAADLILLCGRHGIAPRQVLYLGDDVNDLVAMGVVGFRCAPADACGAALEAADYVARRKGGEGVVREIVDGMIAKEDWTNV